MNVKEEAEQLLEKIENADFIRALRGDFKNTPEYKDKCIDLILKSFEKACREQREADLKYLKDGIGLFDTSLGYGYKKLSDVPLITDKQ